MAQIDLQEVLTFAIDLAHKAGKTIADGQARRFAEGTAVETKKNSADLCVLRVDVLRLRMLTAFQTDRG